MPSWMKWAVALAIGFAIIGIGFRLSWGGTWILKPFFILNCLVLVVVVLLQSGKAADLAACSCGCGAAAERQSRRPCGRFWRRGQSNGFRPARCGKRSLQSYHLVRGHVHGLLLRHGGAHGQGGRGRRFDPSEGFSASAKTGSGDDSGYTAADYA